MSALQLEFLTSVLLILYYLLSLTWPIQVFVFQVYSLSWNLNMVTTQDPPSSLKETLKTDDISLACTKEMLRDSPGGPGVESLPANAGHGLYLW